MIPCLARCLLLPASFLLFTLPLTRLIFPNARRLRSSLLSCATRLFTNLITLPLFRSCTTLPLGGLSRSFALPKVDKQLLNSERLRLAMRKNLNKARPIMLAMNHLTEDSDLNASRGPSLEGRETAPHRDSTRSLCATGWPARQ